MYVYSTPMVKENMIHHISILRPVHVTEKKVLWNTQHLRKMKYHNTTYYITIILQSPSHCLKPHQQVTLTPTTMVRSVRQQCDKTMCTYQWNIVIITNNLRLCTVTTFLPVTIDRSDKPLWMLNIHVFHLSHFTSASNNKSSTDVNNKSKSIVTDLLLEL